MGTTMILLGFGLIFVNSRTVPPESMPPVTEQGSEGSAVKHPTHRGVVIANDETATSPPRTISLEQSTAATESRRHRKRTKLVGKTVVINNKEYPLRTYKLLALPNDPMANQWWVDNARLGDAWEIPPGNYQTTLAVIDTGFALKHEEFTNRLHTNPGESGLALSENPSSLNCADRGLTLNSNCNLIDDDRDGTIDNEAGETTYQNPSRLNCTAQGRSLAKDCNRIDDDNNGHVDDIQGWDFINNDNSTQAGELNPSGDGTKHGTMVAGVAAATGNNAKGIAGVDWNTKILPIQALDDDSYGDTLSVGQAIYYAVEQGADVINISLGTEFQDSYVQEAIHTAVKAGIVVVAAAGNDGCECMVYPAAHPEVIGAGALNSSNQPTSFSSWGSGLDILAPGADMTSPSWSATNQTSGYASGINGTSFAAPMVSGALTILLSHQPEATPLQLVAALNENTNRLALSALVPKDNKAGHGALDAFKARQRMTTAKHHTQLYAFTPVHHGEYLNPNDAAEVAGNYVVHQCDAGTVGATSIFEVAGLGKRFFTISRVEAYSALSAGYSTKSFAYSCMQQPHDISDSVRNIDLFQEVLNIVRPL